MTSPSPARDYHDATKHSYASVRPKPALLGLSRPRGLDWANKPEPFRWFEGAPASDLPGARILPDPVGRAGDVLGRLLEPPLERAPLRFDLSVLSSLFQHSVAISAWKQAKQRDGSVERWALRVNPSSGNLHPTEVYLALRDGLHHYRADRHALELRRKGDAVAALLAAAGRPAAGVQGVLAITTIFWREAWKYEERAYRYCMLDAGHAAHALLLAARSLGIAGGVLARFDDDVVGKALACREGREVPVLLIPLASPELLRELGPAERARELELEPPLGTPNALSRAERPLPRCEAIDAATRLSGDALAAGTGSLRARPLARPIALPAPGTLDESFAALVRRRRSALDFDLARSRLSLEDLATLLALARAPFPFDATGSWWSAPRASDGLSLHLWAHSVTDLEPGLYRVADDGRALELVRAADLREEAGYVSLEQEIARDGAATLSIVADLDAHLGAQGARGYRDAHVLAGALGHALYLAAHAVGAGATGMGAFYDDDAAKALALAPGLSPVYHFAVGAPVHDARLI
jgi:SagB-type dehydrogenase family enzyme